MVGCSLNKGPVSEVMVTEVQAGLDSTILLLPGSTGLTRVRVPWFQGTMQYLTILLARSVEDPTKGNV